jgi:hypothetical protein
VTKPTPPVVVGRSDGVALATALMFLGQSLMYAAEQVNDGLRFMGTERGLDLTRERK